MTTTTAVDRFLAAVAGATMAAATDVYDPRVTLDATVPGWRFTRRGEAAVREEYGGWFAHPAEVEELVRHPIPGGEVVEYTVSWLQDDGAYAAHHVHVLLVAGDRITSDHCWCGGRWPAALLAEMGAAEQVGG